MRSNQSDCLIELDTVSHPPGFTELAPIEIGSVIVTLFGLVMQLVGYYRYRQAEDLARQSGNLAAF